jgi:5-methylcytosine-specific restriction endonuclease McrA
MSVATKFLGMPKACRICSRVEPEVRFRPGSRQCGSCERTKYRAKCREWAARNPERCRAKVRRYRLKDIETSRRRTREGVRALRARRPRMAAEAMQRYRARHPDRVRVSLNRIRAKRLAAPGGGVSAAAWEAVLQLFGRCAYCGRVRSRYEMDHIEPLSAGGCDCPENVAPACQRCNRSKHNKSLLIWLATGSAL